ncbi:MAG: response regulator transcription factor [Comamonadaceae bacterium]|nr:response regulator transcription factor [Comamonadaceae bacterium]
MVNQPASPTALIAEDEPLLAAALQAELARAWPQLSVLACVGDGLSAVEQTLTLQPDVLFFDIRMPGQSGLEAAVELADAWDTRAKPFPALVFVTAYDQYAVQAFEVQAIDYLLKPVQPRRLQKTLEKVQLALSHQAQTATVSEANMAANESHLQATVAQLQQLLAALPGSAPAAPRLDGPLELIAAGVGSTVHMVPVHDVVYFEAADKYVRVLTATREYLIRTPLKELLPQLSPVFWQIHRSTVVNSRQINSVTRDEAGKLWLHLQHRPEKMAVSRLYAGLFRAM